MNLINLDFKEVCVYTGELYFLYKKEVDKLQKELELAINKNRELDKLVNDLRNELESQKG